MFVKECIYIDQTFGVQLSYDGISLPLPEYIQQSPLCKVQSLNMLTNLPNYCRNFKSQEFEIDAIKDLIKLNYFRPKRRPKYSSRVIQFALLSRCTSNSGYTFLKKYLPLPCDSLIKNLKSHSIKASSALSGLRDNSFIGTDVVLLLDEMHLQQQVQFDRKTIVGCDEELHMYKYYVLWWCL